MKLSELQLGMIIEYERIVGRGTIDRRLGKIEAITDRFLTVSNGRYNSTITVRDLKTGWARILTVKEGVEGMREKIAVPSKEELQKVFEDTRGLLEFSGRLKVSTATGRRWLLEAGIQPKWTDRHKQAEQEKRQDYMEAEQAGKVKDSIAEPPAPVDQEIAPALPAGEGQDITRATVITSAWGGAKLEGDPQQVAAIRPGQLEGISGIKPTPPAVGIQEVNGALLRMSSGSAHRALQVIYDPVALMIIKDLIAEGRI